MRRTTAFAGLSAALLAGSLLLSQTRLVADVPPTVAVYTYHGDNMRTGWNSQEALLTHDTVNTARFGRLWDRPVDGQVYAQPLYAPGVKINATDTRSLVFVATEHNSVYAFDGDTGGDAPLWQVNLGPSVPNAGAGGVA